MHGAGDTLGLTLNSFLGKFLPVSPRRGNKKTRDCVEFFIQ